MIGYSACQRAVATACSAAKVAFKPCYAAGQSACAAGGYVAAARAYAYSYSACQKAAAAACRASNGLFAPCYAAAQKVCAAGCAARKYAAPVAKAAGIGLRAARAVIVGA